MAARLPAWAVRMREARLAKMLSVKALAKLASLSHGTVENAEDGEALSVRSAEAIAKALGMTLSEFFE